VKGRIVNLAAGSQPDSRSATQYRMLSRLFRERLTREIAFSMVSCVHCGACAQACHYALARAHDPCMTPAYKADQIRRMFNRNMNWICRILSGRLNAGTSAADAAMERLRDIVFGACTGCRRCTFNCPIGVDNAALIRFTRGILTEMGVVPEGLSNASRNQWLSGNQMSVTEEEFFDSLDWIKAELQYELGVGDLDILVDKEDCDIIYAVNPREIKYDPHSLMNAAKLFYLAGESWTLPRYGWDQTNFGLFSGDDRLGAFMAGNLYRAAERLRARRIVVSECGHGYRSVRWEGYSWANNQQTIPTESVVETVMRYLIEGRIKVDRLRNTGSVTFHDSCNVARYGGLVEEPRWVLKQVCSDFREMYPNGVNNFCCTGGGGLLTMPEYRPLRLEVARIKADQLKVTEADTVCTMCHNCRDGLGDLIDHYQLNMKVVQVMDLVAEALVLPPGNEGNINE